MSFRVCIALAILMHFLRPKCRDVQMSRCYDLQGCRSYYRGRHGAAMELTLVGILSTEGSAILQRGRSVNRCVGSGMPRDVEDDLK